MILLNRMKQFHNHAQKATQPSHFCKRWDKRGMFPIACDNTRILLTFKIYPLVLSKKNEIALAV